ncbi:MAG: response regulator [Burkholderiaceae bacterium]
METHHACGEPCGKLRDIWPDSAYALALRRLPQKWASLALETHVLSCRIRTPEPERCRLFSTDPLAYRVAAMSAAPMSVESGFPSARILAVDDCPVQRVLITRQLESAGYLVVAVETGREALRAVRCGRYDAVILDVNMPDMGGPEVGRALRADPATSGLSIIMHSTDSEAEVRERFSGFDAFVSKPSSARQLIEEVDEVIMSQAARGTAKPLATAAAW